MNILKRKKEGRTAYATPQTARREPGPFGTHTPKTPADRGELRLYRAIRETVPVVDAAILKLIRLTGGFSARAGSEHATRALNDFLRTVDVGRGQRGIQSFLDAYLDSLITCGMAVGEVVPRIDGSGIAAVLCGNVEDIALKEGASPLDFRICAAGGFGEPEPLPRQDLLLFTPFNPEAGSPYGVSLLRSMPALSEVLMKIYRALGANWERVGNVRFAVTYKPREDERFDAAERGEQLAREWANAMQDTRSGSIRDFVAVGDVGIQVIGAENQIPDSEVPVRQILEQLIARTGIPPFMLGLNWSTTERMSSQQADLMTSEITAIRRSVTPALERIAELFLRFSGYDPHAEILWEDINLQDEVEEARAALYLAQTEKLNRETGGTNG